MGQVGVDIAKALDLRAPIDLCTYLPSEDATRKFFAAFLKTYGTLEHLPAQGSASILEDIFARHWISAKARLNSDIRGALTSQPFGYGIDGSSL